MRVALVLFLIANSAWGAFEPRTSWEVRTGGSDSNGGGFFPHASGTDYSQQDAAQVAYTDIVIGGTTTQATSAATPFTTAMQGNVVNITAGAGCTVQRAQITNVSGSTATFDKSLGTAASVCTGNLGGGLLTIALATTSAATYNQIFIKSGTYTFTSEIDVGNKIVTFNGYETTRGDRGARPLITTSTNSHRLFRVSQYQASYGFANINFSTTAATRAAGIGVGQSGIHVTDAVFDGFTIGIDGQTISAILGSWLSGVEIKNCTTSGVSILFNSPPVSVYTSYMDNVYIHDNAIGINFNQEGAGSITNSVISANTSQGIYITDSSAPISMYLNNVTVANNGGTGMFCTGGSIRFMSVMNSIFYGNGGFGIDCETNTNGSPFTPQNYRKNGFGSNTSGNVDGNTLGGTTGLNPITITANPFTNSGAGNYSLNSTAGGGAALKGAGYVGILTGNSINVGAVQNSGAAAAATIAYPMIQ